MTTQGMNPTLVRSAADEIDRAASSLQALVGSINGTVGRMSAGWFGADVEQLVHQWQRVSRPAVETLANEAHDLAARARRQAHDQEIASGAAGVDAASGSAHRGSALWAVIAGGAGLLGRADGILSPINRILGLGDTVAKNVGVLKRAEWLRASRRLGHGWKAVTSTAKSLAAGHVPTGISKFLRTSQGEHFLTHGGRLLKGAGVVGSVVSVFGSGAKAADDFHNGRNVEGVQDSVDVVANSLKSSKFPVAYAGGVTLAVWNDASREAMKIDWSQPVPAPTPKNLVTMYAPALGEGVAEVGRRLFGYLS